MIERVLVAFFTYFSFYHADGGDRGRDILLAAAGTAEAILRRRAFSLDIAASIRRERHSLCVLPSPNPFRCEVI